MVADVEHIGVHSNGDAVDLVYPLFLRVVGVVGLHRFAVLTG